MKNGFAMSSRTTPIVRLLPTRSWCAAVLRTNRVESIASSTRLRVVGDTTDGLLSTFDTVPRDTCARLATSRMVTRRLAEA